MGSGVRSSGLGVGCFGSRRCGAAGVGVVVLCAKPGEPDTIGAAAYQASNPATKHGRVEVRRQTQEPGTIPFKVEFVALQTSNF